MRNLFRVLPLTLVAMLIVLAAACGGTSKTTSNQIDGDPLVALSTSAERFQDEVESLESDLQFAINAGGFEIDTSAEMAFQAPDQMHLTMTVTGLGEFEMLMLGTEIYMNVPG